MTGDRDHIRSTASAFLTAAEDRLEVTSLVYPLRDGGFELIVRIAHGQVENARRTAADFIAAWPNAPTDELDDEFPMAGKDPNGLIGILFGTRCGMLVEVLYDESGDLFKVTYVPPSFVEAAYPKLFKAQTEDTH